MRTDDDLLEAWRAGDQAAANELFDRHFDGLYGFFVSKAPAHADDLVQRTFLACVEGRDRFRGDSKFRTYLYAVARYVFYAHLEERRRDADVDYGVTSVHDLDPSPTQAAAKRDEEKLVIAALRRLPVDMQVAVELYYVQGFRGPEIALILDVPEATVRSRIRRALERVRGLVAKLAENPRLIHSTLSRLDQWHAPDDGDSG